MSKSRCNGFEMDKSFVFVWPESLVAMLWISALIEVHMYNEVKQEQVVGIYISIQSFFSILVLG